VVKRRRNMGEKRRYGMDQAYATMLARGLGSLRRRHERPCASCGEPRPMLAIQKFCSVRCRVAADRKRKLARGLPANAPAGK
jgi:hypothetical protein